MKKAFDDSDIYQLLGEYLWAHSLELEHPVIMDEAEESFQRMCLMTHVGTFLKNGGKLHFFQDSDARINFEDEYIRMLKKNGCRLQFSPVEWKILRQHMDELVSNASSEAKTAPEPVVH